MLELELVVKDRLVFESFLPNEGSFIDIKVSKDLREKVEFSQEEMKSINMRSRDNGDGTSSTLWDSEKDVAVKIEITEYEQELLKKQFNVLDKSLKIDVKLFDLALKIKNL